MPTPTPTQRLHAAPAAAPRPAAINSPYFRFKAPEMTPLRLAAAIKSNTQRPPTRKQLRGELHVLRLQQARIASEIAALETQLATPAA